MASNKFFRSRKAKTNISLTLLAAFIFSFFSFCCCDQASAITRGARKRIAAKQSGTKTRKKRQAKTFNPYPIKPGRTTMPIQPGIRIYSHHTRPIIITPPYGPIDPPYGPIDPPYGPIDPPYGPIDPPYGPIDPPYGPIDPEPFDYGSALDHAPGIAPGAFDGME